MAGSRKSPEECFILGSSSRADSVYRCIPAGVGDASGSLLGVRNVDYGGTKSPYQPAGALSSFSSPTEVSSGSVGLCSLHNVQQLHDGGLSKELGGTRSESLLVLAGEVLRWCESLSISLRSMFFPGRHNLIADVLCQECVGSEWTLHPEVCRALFQIWGSPLVNLFATALNRRPPLYVSPLLDQAAWKRYAFSFP